MRGPSARGAKGYGTETVRIISFDDHWDRFADWLDPERMVGNLHRAYAELAGLPRGGRIDIIAALNDMVEYNGGRPLTCRA